MSTAALVGSLVGAIVAAQLVLWLWFRHRRRTLVSRLESELQDDATVRAPEPCSYQGSTIADLPAVSYDGVMALTRSRLVFRSLIGKTIDIPVTEITGVHGHGVFDTAATNGREHLTVRTPRGDVGFLVGDNAGWIASLTTAADRPLAVESPSPDESRFDASHVIRRRRTSMTILAVGFTSLGVVCGLVSGIGAGVTAVSISGDHRGIGTVVDLSDEGRGYAPVVDFVPTEGPSVRFIGSLSSNPPTFRVGEQVPVRYDPDHPQDARIDTYWQTWFLPALTGIFAVAFLAVGIGFGIVTRSNRRRAST